MTKKATAKKRKAATEVAERTASQHAQLLIGEALAVFVAGADDPRGPEAIAAEAAMKDAIAAALKSDNADDVVSFLACTAAEAWTRYAMSQGTVVGDVLRAVFENWDRSLAQ